MLSTNFLTYDPMDEKGVTIQKGPLQSCYLVVLYIMLRIKSNPVAFLMKIDISGFQNSFFRFVYLRPSVICLIGSDAVPS